MVLLRWLVGSARTKRAGLDAGAVPLGSILQADEQAALRGSHLPMVYWQFVFEKKLGGVNPIEPESVAGILHGLTPLGGCRFV
jgi:hypothetical protein